MVYATNPDISNALGTIMIRIQKFITSFMLFLPGSRRTDSLKPVYPPHFVAGGIRFKHKYQTLPITKMKF